MRTRRRVFASSLLTPCGNGNLQESFYPAARLTAKRNRRGSQRRLLQPPEPIRGPDRAPAGNLQGPAPEKHHEGARAKAERMGELVCGIRRQCGRGLGDGRQALPVLRTEGHQPRITGLWLSDAQGKAERDVERRRTGEKEAEDG